MGFQAGPMALSSPTGSNSAPDANDIARGVPGALSVSTVCESDKPDIDTSGPRRILRVGPRRSLKTPSAAAAIAKDHDIIQIEASTYKCDVTKWRASGLFIQGTCGRPHLDADGCAIDNGKGIWNPVSTVVDLTVENIEFSGAKVGDMNGAGIRWDGTGAVKVNGCYFHHNQNGILFTPIDMGPDSKTDLTVSNSEFGYNGAGDGYSHNMYISQTRTFTLIGSYSHHTIIGNIVKSRANNNFILYNRIADEDDGNSSYAIDLPQGGVSYVIGNIIQQGVNSPNYTMLEFSAESQKNPAQKIYIAFNTFHNEITKNGQAIILYDKGLEEAVVADNFFVGFADQDHVLKYGTAGSMKKATMQNNLAIADPTQAGFQDLARYNYYLSSSSPAKGMGANPGSYNGQSLLPTRQYRHPATSEERTSAAQPSVGALEYDGRLISAPTLEFAATRTTIDYQGTVTLTWASTQALFCMGVQGPDGFLPLTGTWTSQPLIANKTLSISCTGVGGTIVKSIAITVNDSAQAAALGTYTWQRVAGSMINAVCAATMKDASGKYLYSDNFGTGPYCETKGSAATGIFVPETGKYYLVGGGGSRSYYGNEVYAFDFATQKSELVTTPTLISQTSEYTPDDPYGSKIHLATCDGILHLKSGGIVPAPRGIIGSASYNPFTKKIIVGPAGYVNGIGNCTGSNAGGLATDMWSFDPRTKTWALLSGADDRFGSVTNGTWFMDPATAIAFYGSNRNGSTRGGYLIDSTPSQPAVRMVDNVWPFQALSGPIAIDTDNQFAFQFQASQVVPSTAAYNLSGLSISAYGTNGASGSTGTAGGPGPLYKPDTTWTFAGDTTLFTLKDFAVTYNPKLRKIVAWAGGDTLYFLTPDYVAKRLEIISKLVYGNPVSTVSVANKFSYIPDRDIYVAFVGTQQDFYYLVPPK
jgi:hypothetical protein